MHLSFTEVDDRSFEALAPLGGLGALYLKATGVTAAGLSTLRAFPELRMLHLGGLRPDRRGLIHVAALEQLAGLHLGGTRVTDDDITALEGASALRSLILFETRVHGPGLDALGSTGLRSLDLLHTRLRADAMSIVAKISSLRDLSLPLGIRGREFAHLGPLEHLERLVFAAMHSTRPDGGRRYHGVDDAALSWLPSLPSLRCLDLTMSPITDVGLARVARFRGLRELSLRCTRITSNGITTLRGHPALTTLELQATGVGDDAIEALATLPALRSLDLGGTRLSAAGVRRIVASGARHGAWSRLDHLVLPAALLDPEIRDLFHTALPGTNVIACNRRW